LAQRKNEMGNPFKQYHRRSKRLNGCDCSSPGSYFVSIVSDDQ
jgi:hypothetical protein